MSIKHIQLYSVVNKFKYTGSIKNEPSKSKRRIPSAREERYVLNKIRKYPRLSAYCETVTKQFAVKIGFDLQKNIWIRIKKIGKTQFGQMKRKIIYSAPMETRGFGGKLIDETIRKI